MLADAGAAAVLAIAALPPVLTNAAAAAIRAVAALPARARRGGAGPPHSLHLVRRRPENYPQKRSFRLADYHPLWVWGVN